MPLQHQSPATFLEIATEVGQVASQNTQDVYAEHVSIEFGMGCELDDGYGRLEGSGKFRRHLIVRSSADLKGIEPYLAQACANANGAS